ncbi:MAG: SRPBCC family protein [Mycobacteriales bacterium]
MAVPVVMDYRGDFAFAASPEEVWALIERVDRYPAWWGWIREFRCEGGLRSGGELSGQVVPPVPYRMRVRVGLRCCDRPRHIDATVAGDLRGWATLDLAGTPEGCVVTAEWSVEMMPAAMRLAARVAYPLLRWGHDRVVAATVSRFQRELTESNRSRPGLRPSPQPGDSDRGCEQDDRR